MSENQARTLQPGTNVKETKTGNILSVQDTEHYAGTLFVICEDGRSYHPAQLSSL